MRIITLMRRFTVEQWAAIDAEYRKPEMKTDVKGIGSLVLATLLLIIRRYYGRIKKRVYVRRWEAAFMMAITALMVVYPFIGAAVGRVASWSLAYNLFHVLLCICLIGLGIIFARSIARCEKTSSQTQ